MLDTLKKRFEKNMHRHPYILWTDVIKKLTPEILKKLEYLEESEGEPDLVVYDSKWLFVDCSKESPIKRRSCCYDQIALENRKTNKPLFSAMQMIENWGVNILTKELYFHIQNLEDFDLKTSSWILTPSSIRIKGGALFGDKRYGETFIYHNGADSYYSSRGFRTYIELEIT